MEQRKIREAEKQLEDNQVYCLIDGDICEKEIHCRDCHKRKLAKAIQDFIWGDDDI